jgi:hypothetical protein
MFYLCAITFGQVKIEHFFSLLMPAAVTVLKLLMLG